MSAIATAIVGSAVIGGVASSRAADKASKAQRGAADASIGEQRRQFDLTRADFAPYREEGARALDRLWNPDSFDTSADTKFSTDHSRRPARRSGSK